MCISLSEKGGKLGPLIRYQLCLMFPRPSFFFHVSPGLTIAFTCLEGEFSQMYAEAQAAKISLRQGLRDEGVKGFADVCVSSRSTDGIAHV